jgi:hypothetical protein
MGRLAASRMGGSGGQGCVMGWDGMGRIECERRRMGWGQGWGGREGFGLVWFGLAWWVCVQGRGGIIPL